MLKRDKKSKKIIYMDYASTTPMSTEVVLEMRKYFLDNFGNPSGLHYISRRANEALEFYRAKVAKIIGVDGAREIIFTGSGTESDNLAILGFARKNKKFGNHIITTKIEHHAVLHPCQKLEREGFEVSYLDVDKNGLVRLEDLKKALKKETILVSIIYANNEIGVIQDIKKISKLILEYRIKNHQSRQAKRSGQELRRKSKSYELEVISYPLFHTDACQAAGYLDINVKKLDVDMMTLNGSKIYGPKGVGMLYVKNGIDLEPIIYGGEQEFGLRSGTQSVAQIAGFAKALEIADKNKKKESARIEKLRDYFIRGLFKKILNIRLNGHSKKRLPNNVNVSILNIEGEAMLLMLDKYGICVSTGSACSANSLKPSHVLTALGISDEIAHGSLRFTLGKYTTKKDINYVLKILPEIVGKLRAISPISI